MFSTCNAFVQNQAVLPLSSIISQYSNIRGHRHKVKCAQQDRVPSKDVNRSSILFSESLSETSKKFSENDLKEIRQLVTPKVLHHLALYGPELLLSRLSSLTTGLYRSVPLSTLKERKTWYESHVSCNTFLENKLGSVSLSDLTREPQVRPLFRITQDLIRSQQNLSASYIPNRGFKTQQYIERKKKQKKTLAERLKESLKSKKPASNKALPQNTTNNAKLKNMVNGEVPKEVQRNLKVAFAEGYLSAAPKKVKVRFQKLLQSLYHLVSIFVFVAFFMSIMGGGIGGSMFRMNVYNGNEVHPEDVSVCFDDVKGIDDAKEELQQIVEFLKNPEKYTSLGAELPKGVLLVGAPGTGKTLLARAVAGEAGVPFFHAAGPEFDEILVGQGARRIRDLFFSAKAKAPCVIFIDEIDSVGSKRSNSVVHPYANQTINQLLTEMDGFHKNEGVIVLGATNRHGDLDKALLRPGRFDVEVVVPVPDLAGREEIFTYYLGKLKIGEDVDKKILSRGTTGFTGADIKNLANLAALRAASDQVDFVSMKHLESARDKVLMGPERKCRIPDKETNTITAYHEAGHAVVSYYTKDSHPLHKVTILPRGPVLGHTAYIPAKEHYHVTKSQMKAKMDTLMGGRAAEELAFGADTITSGASSDLKEATRIATNMVKYYGMSSSVGFRFFTESRNRYIIEGNSLGDTTKESIDAEIRRLLQESYDRAKVILKNHEKEHRAVAEALIKYETLDASDVKAILNGQAPK